MTNDEKAKAYDMALEAARKELGVDRKEWEVVQRVLHNIFPELRESEDERIRKAVVSLVYEMKGTYQSFAKVELDKMVDWLEKQKEQKPVDYDHEMWKNCEANFEGGKKEVIDHPGKYGLQKKQKPAEWSEEDKDYYDTIVRKLEVIGDDSGLSSNQIKFLREHCPLSSSEWNEEDETIIEGACSALEIYGHTKLASRLKSLRPSWKPSEEQMKALEVAFRKDGDDNYRNAINSLYNDLKKL